ncbi:MAG: hypothetical protein K7J15_04315, partial [Candidatus Regiella insecticola]|nr:hypothetical protein [Candidatus Regiella insecticola]MCX2959582.1 hypothetical protein [Serratia symbiotica]
IPLCLNPSPYYEMVSLSTHWMSTPSSYYSKKKKIIIIIIIIIINYYYYYYFYFSDIILESLLEMKKNK